MFHEQITSYSIYFPVLHIHKYIIECYTDAGHDLFIVFKLMYKVYNVLSICRGIKKNETENDSLCKIFACFKPMLSDASWLTCPTLYLCPTKSKLHQIVPLHIST